VVLRKRSMFFSDCTCLLHGIWFRHFSSRPATPATPATHLAPVEHGPSINKAPKHGLADGHGVVSILALDRRTVPSWRPRRTASTARIASQLLTASCNLSFMTLHARPHTAVFPFRLVSHPATGPPLPPNDRHGWIQDHQGKRCNAHGGHLLRHDSRRA
jgi:hypothetical protein